jgi:hypothetical protein
LSSFDLFPATERFPTVFSFSITIEGACLSATGERYRLRHDWSTSVKYFSHPSTSAVLLSLNMFNNISQQIRTTSQLILAIDDCVWSWQLEEFSRPPPGLNLYLILQVSVCRQISYLSK